MTTPQDAKARAEAARARVVSAVEQGSPEAVDRCLRMLTAFLAEPSGPVVEEKR